MLQKLCLPSPAILGHSGVRGQLGSASPCTVALPWASSSASATPESGCLGQRLELSPVSPPWRGMTPGS